MRREARVAHLTNPKPEPQTLHNREPSKEVLSLIAAASAFCFDVDSTVCVDEGIDELAGFLGKGASTFPLRRAPPPRSARLPVSCLLRSVTVTSTVVKRHKALCHFTRCHNTVPFPIPDIHMALPD